MRSNRSALAVGASVLVLRMGAFDAAQAAETPSASYLAFRDGAAVPSDHLTPGMFELQDAYMRRLAAAGQTWSWSNMGIAAAPAAAVK